VAVGTVSFAPPNDDPLLGTGERNGVAYGRLAEVSACPGTGSAKMHPDPKFLPGSVGASRCAAAQNRFGEFW